jgi:pyruvate dehydrogenase E2 component (dihydrolipoamide acetyltransferase)
MGEFRMPSLGADMVRGRLVEWKVRPGDAVRRGDIVADVETDKGVIEVEVFEDGVVEELLLQEGAEVPVGTPMARIRGAAEATWPTTPPVATGVRSSPAARKLAEDLGIDVARVAGTGPQGAVTREDVEREAAAASAPGAGVERTSPDSARMRRAIAATMTRSKREIPHSYLGTAIDFGPAAAWLAEENARRGIEERLLPAALLLKAVALAARDVPEVNGLWTDGVFHPAEAVHLGVAISLRGGGLVAPAILHADRLAVGALMVGLRDLVRRARDGGLRGSEMTGGTLTVTNLGDRGVDQVYGIIHPPQVALVGVGRIAERAWVLGREVVARPVVEVTVAADHRAVDGHRAGLFLDAIVRRLADPGAL